MKKIITNSLLVAGLTFTTACGGKEKNTSNGGNSPNQSESGQVTNEDKIAELKSKLNKALVKEMFGDFKHLISHSTVDTGFPHLTLQFESAGENFSLSFTKGKDSNGDPVLDAISKNYTDGEFVKEIGDRAYLNRKLKNISVVEDGALYHISCIKRVSFDEERTKILAKKILAK